MKIIGFCGLPGSGKSSAIEAIKDLGIIITMGDVIRNEAKKRNIEPSGKNLGKIASELREKGGPDIIAIKCVELIKNTNSEVVFIDGLRSNIEVNVFKKYWKFPIIAIKLDEKTRFERLLNRGRSDDPKTIEELRNRDEREKKFGVDEVIKNADYKIKNDIPEKEFKKKVRELVLKILKEY